MQIRYVALYRKDNSYRLYEMPVDGSDAILPPLLKHFSILYVHVLGSSITIDGMPYVVYREAVIETRSMRLIGKSK